MFPTKIWDFGLAYNSVTLPSFYLGQARWLLNFLDLIVKASLLLLLLFCSSQNERLPAEMYVWFSCKAIKLSTKTKLEFFKSNSQLLLGYSPPPPPARGYSPMKMSGVLVEKVPKTYFVGMAWT